MRLLGVVQKHELNMRNENVDGTRLKIFTCR